MNNFTEFLIKRRSTLAKKMSIGVVNNSDLKKILEIGIRVPDHGALKPWKLKVIKGKTRKYLDEEIILKEFKKNNSNASQKELLLESKRFQRAHTIIAVVSSPILHKKIPEWEQVLSAGAVCSNILYAAQALGYAAQWLTEWYSYNENLAKALDINYKKEKIAGFIYIGKKNEQPNERKRPKVEDIVKKIIF